MIVVIGAGISGLSLSYELLKRGEEVTVLEAGGVASQTSGIATAYLEPRLGATPIRNVERESSRWWPGLAAEIEHVSGKSVGFNQSGQIKVSRVEHLEQFQVEFEQRRSEGWVCRPVNPFELNEMEPALSNELSAAALYSEVAWLDGAAFCQALAVGIRSLGGCILENWKVRHIAETNSGISIQRDSGDIIKASKVAICNAMGRNEITGIPADIAHCQPIRGVTLVLDQSTMPTPVTHLIKHQFGHLCPLSSQKLIVGTTYEKTISNLTVSDAVIELLYTRAESVLPSIRDLPLLEVNAGLRARSPDGLLQIGRSQVMPRLFFSLGHGGSGYLRAPVVMNTLAEFLVTGEKSGPAAFMLSP